MSYSEWNDDQRDGVWNGEYTSLGTASRVGMHRGRHPEREFTDRFGRRCRIVCEERRPQNPQFIARELIGLNLQQAQRIYPHIRVVVRDGQQLPVTMDYRSDRINVETRNGVIVRIVGFY